MEGVLVGFLGGDFFATVVAEAKLPFSRGWPYDGCHIETSGSLGKSI